MNEKEIEDFLRKVEEGLAEARYNMLEEKALHNSSIVISDGCGSVCEIPARQILSQ